MQKQFDRGYMNAKEVAKRTDVRELRREWYHCQADDDYDRGYDKALREIEETLK